MHAIVILISILAGLHSADAMNWPAERLDNYMIMQNVYEEAKRGYSIERIPDFAQMSNEYVNYLCNTKEIRTIYVKYKYDTRTEKFQGGDREIIKNEIKLIIATLLDEDKEAKRLHQRLLKPIQRLRDNIMAKCMENKEYANALLVAKDKGWDVVPNFSPIILYGEDIVIMGMHPK